MIKGKKKDRPKGNFFFPQLCDCTRCFMRTVGLSSTRAEGMEGLNEGGVKSMVSICGVLRLNA